MFKTEFEGMLPACACFTPEGEEDIPETGQNMVKLSYEAATRIEMLFEHHGLCPAAVPQMAAFVAAITVAHISPLSQETTMQQCDRYEREMLEVERCLSLHRQRAVAVFRQKMLEEGTAGNA